MLYLYYVGNKQLLIHIDFDGRKNTMKVAVDQLWTFWFSTFFKIAFSVEEKLIQV